MPNHGEKTLCGPGKMHGMKAKVKMPWSGCMECVALTVDDLGTPTRRVPSAPDTEASAEKGRKAAKERGPIAWRSVPWASLDRCLV